MELESVKQHILQKYRNHAKELNLKRILIDLKPYQFFENPPIRVKNKYQIQDQDFR